jgi:hypothetical protein
VKTDGLKMTENKERANEEKRNGFGGGLSNWDSNQRNTVNPKPGQTVWDASSKGSQADCFPIGHKDSVSSWVFLDNQDSIYNS